MFNNIINFGKKNVSVVLRTKDVESYLMDIEKYPVLSIEEEETLTWLIKAGDKEARETLILANLRAVVSIAKNYAYCSGSSLTLCDLINEGNIGLMHSIDKFDPSVGVRFLSFAVNDIRAAITSALSRKSRVVSNSESFTHTSLDAPVNEDGDTTLGDTLCVSHDKDTLTDESLYNDIMRVLHSTLKESDVDIICDYYGLGRPIKSKSQIATERNRSEECIRIIIERAKAKIRNNENAIRLLAQYI